MRYEINLEGMEDLMDAIDKAKDKGPVRRIVRVNTAEMANASQRLVPVDTGTLKRSMGLAIRNDSMEGEISYNTEYAIYQELGTRFMQGRFYVKQAFDKQSDRFIQDLEELFK